MQPTLTCGLRRYKGRRCTLGGNKPTQVCPAFLCWDLRLNFPGPCFPWHPMLPRPQTTFCPPVAGLAVKVNDGVKVEAVLGGCWGWVHLAWTRNQTGGWGLLYCWLPLAWRRPLFPDWQCCLSRLQGSESWLSWRNHQSLQCHLQGKDGRNLKGNSQKGGLQSFSVRGKITLLPSQATVSSLQFQLHKPITLASS